MAANSPKHNVPFSAIKAALDRNLTGELRETRPTFSEAVGDLQGAYSRYGGRKPFARATGLPESTLRRWEKQVQAGKTPKISKENENRLTGAVKKVERIMRLTTETENHLRNSPMVRVQATFQGQADRGERTIFLNQTKRDKAGFKKAADKLITAYINGSKKHLMDAMDDMLDAYDPDIADSYFSVESLAALVIA